MGYLSNTAPRTRNVLIGAMVMVLAVGALAAGVGRATPTSADQFLPHLTIAAGSTGAEAVPGGVVQITPAKSVGASVGAALSESGGYTSLAITANNGAKASGKPLSICINIHCRTYTLDSSGSASAMITPWGGIR